MATEIVAVRVGPNDGFSDDDQAQLDALSGRQDAKSLAKVRSILQRYPDALAKVGDMARHLEHNIIVDLASGPDTLVADALVARCKAMRRSLGYRDASALERLLVDRIVATWLHLHRVERGRRQAWSDGATFERVALYDGAVARAQTDHNRAVMALAKVRRLGLPALQVNIAEAGAQQMNVTAESVAV